MGNWSDESPERVQVLERPTIEPSVFEVPLEGEGFKPPTGVTDPMIRPVVDAQVLQGPVPDYTPDEVAEILRLLHPLRFYVKELDKTITIDCSLEKLRKYRTWAVEDEQERVDAFWRSTGAFQRELAAAGAKAEGAARERVAEEERYKKRQRASAARLDELIQYGLPVAEAMAIVDREFPE